jgi:short-subunit dehydrogenase
MRFSKALVTGSNSGLGEELVKRLKGKGIPCLALTRKEGDLSTPSGRQEVVKLIQKECPDLIINNAGIGFYGDAAFTDERESEAMIAVNVQAVMELTVAGVRTLIDQKRKGVVLNVSSLAGELPTPGMAVYGASKAFVTSFSKAVDMECGPYGIRVLASCPGQIATPFASKAAKQSVQRSKLAMSLNVAADEIFWQIDKEKQGHIYDARHRWLHKLATCLPEKWALKFVYDSIRKRL